MPTSTATARPDPNQPGPHADRPPGSFELIRRDRIVAERREDLIAAARIVANSKDCEIVRLRRQRVALRVIVGAYDAARTVRPAAARIGAGS